MKSVAIIGAGISGLYLANLFKGNKDYKVTIYEKKNLIESNEGYGIQLSVNSVEHLNKIGFDSLTEKEKFHPRKIDFYDRKDKLLKTLVFSDYKQYLNKFWTAHTLKMVNHNTGKETDISITETKYQTGLKDSDFNRQSLKRAR